jgi:putative transcriptional regulator
MAVLDRESAAFGMGGLVSQDLWENMRPLHRAPLDGKHNVTSSIGKKFLDGQCLVAMPTLQDQYFSRAVVYICAHSAEGAMGLTLNHPSPDVSLHDLLLQLKVVDKPGRARLSPDLEVMRVLNGGPVETTRGFVLHSADYHGGESTLAIDEGVRLTATLDILRAMALNEGPRQAVLALGYAGWTAGQLESEILANSWMICPAAPELLFDQDHETKYERALNAIGVDLGFLSEQAGHA